MKYSCFLTKRKTWKIILNCLVIFVLLENYFCKVNFSFSQSDKVMADFTSNSLKTLANSKVMKMERYQIKVNYNKIRLIIHHSKNKEIRLQDIIILKENTIFFNSLTSIKKLMTNPKRIQRLYLIMSKLRSNYYSNTNNCRFFFSYSNTNKKSFNNKFPQLSNVGNAQRNFNILCFSSHIQANNFDNVFSKIYQNHIKNIKNINNLHFLDSNIPMFTPSTIKVENLIGSNEKVDSSQYKYFNYDKNSGNVVSTNNKYPNFKFSFKLEGIVDCEIKTTEKGKLLCVLFKIGENSQIAKKVRICPNESNFLKKMISFVTMKLSLINSCTNKINEAIFLMLKSGVKIDEISKKFKPFSKGFLRNKLEMQIERILHLLSKEKGSKRTELRRIFKKVNKIGRELLLKIKEKQKNLAGLIEKILSKSISKKAKIDNETKGINKEKVDDQSQTEENDIDKKNKTKQKKTKKNHIQKKGKHKSKAKKRKTNNSKSGDKTNKVLKPVKKNTTLKNHTKNENKTNKAVKPDTINKSQKNQSINGNKTKKVIPDNSNTLSKNKTDSQNNTSTSINIRENHTKKFGKEIDNLYKKNLKINMDLFDKKYKDYFNNKKNSSEENNENINDNDSNSLNGNKMILFQTKIPYIMKPILPPSSKRRKCTKNIPPILDACDKNDIYCLCKNHPNYKGCVCAAFPKSVVCIKNYCIDHPKEYECNPKRCENEKKANCKDCFCKKNVKDVKCRCKTDPYSKDCFCTQNPLSHLCNMNACQFNPNSMFCACRTNLRPEMCDPSYCVENSLNPYCKCIVSPGKDECRCLNDPISCNKSEFSEAIVEYDLKIRDACAGNKLYYSINPYMKIKNQKRNNYIVYDKSTDPGLMDPNVIYQMYYPPCKYDPDKPNVLPTEPCIPFPEPPKPCKTNKKSKILKKLKMSAVNKGPCLKKSGCIEGLKKKKNKKQKPKIKVEEMNKNNFKNVLSHQNIPDTLMLYNKWLLFNTNCVLKKRKSVIN